MIIKKSLHIHEAFSGVGSSQSEMYFYFTTGLDTSARKDFFTHIVSHQVSETWFRGQSLIRSQADWFSLYFKRRDWRCVFAPRQIARKKPQVWKSVSTLACHDKNTTKASTILEAFNLKLHAAGPLPVFVWTCLLSGDSKHRPGAPRGPPALSRPNCAVGYSAVHSWFFYFLKSQRKWLHFRFFSQGRVLSAASIWCSIAFEYRFIVQNKNHDSSLPWENQIWIFLSHLWLYFSISHVYFCFLHPANGKGQREHTPHS